MKWWDLIRIGEYECKKLGLLMIWNSLFFSLKFSNWGDYEFGNVLCKFENDFMFVCIVVKYIGYMYNGFIVGVV